jgi:hypothetical protein
MQIYFSHSYRDVEINSYFVDHFVREHIRLQADQKTDVWCVAKLERHMLESTGFVSVIPRRAMEKDPSAYSAYIGHELNLARRARLARLLFVDHKVLARHRLDFPKDAVPFGDDPTDGQEVHAEAIRTFATDIENRVRPPRVAQEGQATVVTGSGPTLLKAGQDAAELLEREDFGVTFITGRQRERGLNDIRLLETLWRSELCVFLLGERLSEAHIALALAHAHGIPSLRLDYDKRAASCKPSLSGTMPWSSSDDMLVELGRQINSYKTGLVAPVELAQTSGAREAMRAMGTMKWERRPENLWDPGDGLALLGHVRPEQGFVKDETNRVRRMYGKSFVAGRDREASADVCRLLYESVSRHRYGYEIEPQMLRTDQQWIRTPANIERHETATCIDLACLFASLLLSCSQNPLIVVLEGPSYAHALAGIRALDERPWKTPNLGDVRRAVELTDALLFEPTGVVEADFAVGAETIEERRDKLLSFGDAKAAAKRLLARTDLRLKYLIDVRSVRDLQG